MMAESQKSEVSSNYAPSSAPTYASSSKPPSSGISLQLSYFKTTPGIIKLVELVS